MYDLQDGAGLTSPLYSVCGVLIGTFIATPLFIAVLIQNFMDASAASDDQAAGDGRKSKAESVRAGTPKLRQRVDRGRVSGAGGFEEVLGGGCGVVLSGSCGRQPCSSSLFAAVEARRGLQGPLPQPESCKGGCRPTQEGSGACWTDFREMVPDQRSNQRRHTLAALRCRPVLPLSLRPARPLAGCEGDGEAAHVRKSRH